MKKEENKQLEQPVAEHAQHDTQHQDQTRTSNHVQVLIPFDASRDNVRRLQTVIRSFQLFAQFYFTPVIVGDRPELFNDSVMAIPFKEGVPHDLVGAAVSGIHSECVNSNFIVAPLETYLNQPLILAHFQIPKCNANGFELRFPIFINKDAMLWVYENIQKDGHALNEDLFTLYFRELRLTPMWLDWSKDFILLPVVSEHPDMAKLDAYSSNKAAVYVQHDLAFDELLSTTFAKLFDDQNEDCVLDLYENPF